MELLSPAGNLEKLKFAYAYGADAAYIGMEEFSLRTRAGNVSDGQIEQLKQVKQHRKLYGAINSFFHEKDITRLEERLEVIAQYPFDAFIVSDLGAADILKKRFPHIELHLSTQANCTNGATAKVYRDFGFSRIILGRETSLDDIKRIKDSVKDLELEVFVHGAMCMAYSGRCFLSAFMTGRSANQGDCAHACRWDYRLVEHKGYERGLALEESQRPGEYFPVYEKDGVTTILSSKDLCMIDHLDTIKESGVDSIKIEGRMKSLYYVATTTRSYRKALDYLEKKTDHDTFSSFRDELFHVSHREYTTGFFFGHEDVQTHTEQGYLKDYLFIGSLGSPVSDNVYPLFLKNPLAEHTMIEFIGPDVLFIEDESFELLDKDLQPIQKLNHHCTGYIRTKANVGEGFIIRRCIS
ncbi:MAG: U32 family peptidase [Sphaerochaetaceae bacterium]|jgi:putative protease|nr:U32 family peptidase [Sphaerochaetaceae bacterium]NLO60138.1 U32 family peptidase [Spirochaetales bacterium]MDD2405364.1 U32 family peptidase [Sphaerochaetaceae bacterium]MDD3670561.1 U32 family peptidase [Sphaerochaetaceae bacterium]MDD4259917.1 U32 family peptidase [Sphaerochaetaceae bacterium]